jgi:outer membrane protein assembly factor BamB
VPIKSLLIFLALPLLAVDWPQWRGVERNGVSPETGLAKSWPAGGPPLVWKAQGLGAGYADFSIAGGILYTQGQRANQQFVLAIDVKTGKKIWETPTGGPYRESRGDGPRGTPTIDGDRLYALAADGTLVCLETRTGKKIWTIDLMKRFQSQVLNWGISESPLVDGERLVVTPGGRDSSVVALNKTNGETIWKSQSDEAGYSSAIAFDLGGIRQIAVLTGDAAIGLNIKNGNLLWRYNKVSNRTANVATPIYRDGYVFFSTDYGTGCALLKLTPQGESVKATEVYFNREMKNHYSSSVLVGDYLYGFSSSILTAMKFQTGDVAWRDRSVGKGSVTFADGKLYLFSENGVVGLAEATPAAYKEISRFQISHGSYPTWTPPVISDGKMYLREQDNLYCYDIKAR